MNNRTIRMNAEIAVGINEIMELNPRITKESEVFPYAYHQVATNILSNSESVMWEEISLLDFKDRQVQATITFSETRGVSVDEEDYNVVLDHYSARPGVKRVQFAYLTRLVLLYTRKKLREMKGVVIGTESKSEVEVEKMNTPLVEKLRIDGVALIFKLAELLLEETEKSKEKILRIKYIMDEE